MGPFCSEQGTSSHKTVMDLASTDEIVILLTDELGPVGNVRTILQYYVMVMVILWFTR